MWSTCTSAELGSISPRRLDELTGCVVLAEEVEGGAEARGVSVSVPLAEDRRYKEQEGF
jgi:hypothetical protein